MCESCEWNVLGQINFLQQFNMDILLFWNQIYDYISFFLAFVNDIGHYYTSSVCIPIVDIPNFIQLERYCLNQ